MDLLHQVLLVAWTSLVGLVLFGFLVRRRRNTSELVGVTATVLEVNDSLVELHKPVGIPSVQILFFHGLPLQKLSSVHLSTWECGDGSSKIWPQTWLVEEFPGAHVFSVRYDQGWIKDCIERLDMKIIRENLLSDLIGGNIGQVRGCPVVLVGHSIGGLVIKQLCVEAHENFGLTQDSRQKAKLKNFLNRIAGIFYYATPHHGIPHISKARDLFDSTLFDYFETLSAEAERLNSSFQVLRQLYSKWQMKGLAEILPVKSGVFRGFVVVPEGAAREGILNVDTADHFSICKPPTKSSRRFNALTQVLQEIVTTSKEEARPENFQYVSKQIVGIGSPFREVQERLETVTSLCLTGMGGSGKTTLAKVVFNNLGFEFEFTCFVPDVQFIEGTKEVLKKEIWEHMHYDGKKVGGDMAWSKLQGKKTLLVLDDISTERDVNVLLDIVDGPSLESSFIATSRLQHLLDDIYEVPLLDVDHCQQLFRSYAFPNQATPPTNLASLIEEIVEKCEGLPLALEVVGQWLRRTQKEEDWKQTLDALIKAEAVTDFNERLWGKLRVSYDRLQENEKQVFLDATTFFGDQIPHDVHRWTLREAKMAWKGAYHVSANLLWQTLVDRSLVYNVEESDIIKVHEQLRSLGKKIASDCNYKIRVWEHLEAVELLQSTNASDKQDVHAFRLKKKLVHPFWIFMGRRDDPMHIASPNLQIFKNMRYLQCRRLIVTDAAPERNWFPSSLIILDCDGLQLFDPASQIHLVILKLWRIDAEYLPNSIGQLSALRIFCLWSARSLRSLPNGIGKLWRLELLELFHCDILQTLLNSIGHLSALRTFNLYYARKLQSLPDEIGQLSRLENLDLGLCDHLETLPETFGQLSNLKVFKLFKCDTFRALPKSFGNLSGLVQVSLAYCYHLQTLPESFGQLCTLTHLEIQICSEFHSLPESFGHLSALTNLKIKDCREFQSLPDSFGKLSALTDLEISGCKEFHSLPESFGSLSALVKFELGDCRKLASLPESFGHLSTLIHLEFSRCGFQTLPDSFGNLFMLSHLKLCKCYYIDSLPKSLGHLAKLQYLETSGYELEILPDSLSALKDLRHLVIDSVSMRSIPEFVGNLPSLQTLELCALAQVTEFPPWLGHTGQEPPQLSRKVFQIQDRRFSLTKDELIRRDFELVRWADERAMMKVRTSAYRDALNHLSVSTFGDLYNEGLLLQEKGIVKRMMGNLQGALEDLTAALEIFSRGESVDCRIYVCYKHRAYVNFLMGNLQMAENDGTMALELLPDYRETQKAERMETKDSGWSPNLGEEQVAYMHFILE